MTSEQRIQSMPFVISAGVCISFCLIAEGGSRNTERFRRLLPGQFSGLPPAINFVKARRQGLGWPAEPDAFRFRGGDPLRLSLTDVTAFILRYEGQHLQNNVTEKSTHKVFASPGIQQRHIDHANVDAFFLCQDAPLFQYLRVVPAQAVNALDIQQVASFQLPQQLPVLRPLEVLPTLFIRIDIAIGDAIFVHGNDLPVFILFFCADTHISIAIAQSILLSVKPAAGSARSYPPDYLS